MRLKITGALLLVFVVLPLAVFGLGIVKAPWVGRADAYKQQQSANNRIQAQALFHDLYNEYQATVAKIPVYKNVTGEGNYQANANLVGLLSHCADVVGMYNAESSKYLTRDFKDFGLPASLDAAACK